METRSYHCKRNLNFKMCEFFLSFSFFLYMRWAGIVFPIYIIFSSFAKTQTLLSMRFDAVPCLFSVSILFFLYNLPFRSALEGSFQHSANSLTSGSIFMFLGRPHIGIGDFNEGGNQSTHRKRLSQVRLTETQPTFNDCRGGRRD